MRTNSWTGSVRLGGAGRANLNNYQVSLRDSSLVIHGGIVIVCRAHADRATVQLDVFEDILRSLFPRFATLPFRRRSLRRFEERFRRRVVRRRAEPRHGPNDAMGAGSSGKPSRRVGYPGRHGTRGSRRSEDLRDRRLLCALRSPLSRSSSSTLLRSFAISQPLLVLGLPLPGGGIIAHLLVLAGPSPRRRAFDAELPGKLPHRHHVGKDRLHRRDFELSVVAFSLSGRFEHLSSLTWCPIFLTCSKAA